MERAPFSSGQARSRPGEYPVGLAFDSSGNLFVSIETFTDPGADSIVYFSSNRREEPVRYRPNYSSGPGL